VTVCTKQQSLLPSVTEGRRLWGYVWRRLRQTFPRLRS